MQSGEFMIMNQDSEYLKQSGDDDQTPRWNDTLKSAQFQKLKEDQIVTNTSENITKTYGDHSALQQQWLSIYDSYNFSTIEHPVKWRHGNYKSLYNLTKNDLVEFLHYKENQYEYRRNQITKKCHTVQRVLMTHNKGISQTPLVTLKRQN